MFSCFLHQNITDSGLVLDAICIINACIKSTADLKQWNSCWVLSISKFIDILTVVQSHAIALAQQAPVLKHCMKLINSKHHMNYNKQ